MLKSLSVFLLLACATVGRAAILDLWTFESPNTPATTTGSTISGILPAVGSGVASGYHASALTVYSSAVGNGSLYSLSADQWAQGDYWQFQLGTIGFSNIKLDWDQTASFVGPTNISVAYSTDGTHFSVVANNVNVLFMPAWTSTTDNSIFNVSLDLSSITVLNNAPNLTFRLISNLTCNVFNPYATGSVDNFLVTGTAVPEPGCLAMFGGIALLLERRLRRGRV